MEGSESFSWDTFPGKCWECAKAQCCWLWSSQRGYGGDWLGVPNHKLWGQEFQRKVWLWAAGFNKFHTGVLTLYPQGRFVKKPVWEVSVLPIVCTLILGREEVMVALAMAGRLLQCLAGKALVCLGTFPPLSPRVLRHIPVPPRAVLAELRAWANTVTA